MDKSRLYDFLGYGPPRADYLFIGLEEYGELNGLQANIARRCTSEMVTPYDDKNRFHRSWSPASLDPTSSARVKVWMMASMVLKALDPKTPEGYIPSKDNQDWHNWYRDLGTAGGNSFLAELFPIPRPAWRFWGAPLPALFPDYRNTDHYQETAWQRRKPQLESLIRGLRPKLVICYGIHGFSYFRQLFSFVKTRFANEVSDLHTLGTYQAGGSTKPHLQIGMETQGTIIAMTGFFKGQHQPSAFKEQRVPTLVRAIRSLQKDHTMGGYQSGVSQAT